MGRIVRGRGIAGIGDRIRQQRERLKLSQGDLADRMTTNRGKRQKPVDRVNISHFENERRIPSAEGLVELARALDCSVDYLLGLTARWEQRWNVAGKAPGSLADEGSGPEAAAGPNEGDRP